MQEVVKECVNIFCKLPGTERARLRRGTIPFLDESKGYDPMDDPCSDDESGAEPTALRGDVFATEAPGKLLAISAACLMKIMYVARYCRHDLLRAGGILASNVIEWTVTCDKKLHRLIEYMELSLIHI